MSYTKIVKLTTDKHSRLASPELFRPTTTYDATRQSDGTIQLVELSKEMVPQARLVRRNGKTFLESDRSFTNDDVAAALAEFP